MPSSQVLFSGFRKVRFLGLGSLTTPWECGLLQAFEIVSIEKGMELVSLTGKILFLCLKHVCQKHCTTACVVKKLSV